MLNFERDVANVGGWLTKKEAITLYDLARSTESKNVIVEIGSWEGRSTICLGKGSQEGGRSKIYAIDPHVGSSEHIKAFGEVDTFDVFLKNIEEAGVSGGIEPVRDTSENTARIFDKPIGFIFIDGAHEYHYVSLDYKIWYPKVVEGGVIAFHDTWHIAGPNFFTAKLLLTSRNIKNPRLADTITYFSKTERNSFADRIFNVGFLIFRFLFGWVGALKMLYWDKWVKRTRKAGNDSRG